VLAALAALTRLPVLAETCRRPLQRAGRGGAHLDLALAAHGRDHVDRAERWRAGAVTTAAAAAAFLDRDPG
jgi:hypothetical protein